ncbi:non-hydrolyzing UDP-N-acetylglucosamine 2-epimerase [Endozoicomonas sp. 8E]|uniref:non-hydrolyzing UDP-N-acetylglucosamine 2-epimerase n=1 Tax=Endozoicomonas sp. 8E TaxID=3035692 RepID=UPI0029392CBA|nr:UDP-N-acetylglucosamine 2-epimerase (non-hydrolyzing) [Endozoicomonas sp. 8E]WOG29201.1 UDP-N-acetylglucosamine 2-epimerase (non-hydrolyzing) [Endozoicomonas sp. 8E]
MQTHTDVTIVTGTRPEIIKMAPVYQELKNQNILVRWCHSGQHRELAEQAFEYFKIVPNQMLSRPPASNLSSLLSGLIQQVNDELNQFLPKVVLTHGDTLTTMAGTLTAFLNKIPLIGHVEAGLRSGSMDHPFPEEANRKVVAVMANRHYAPSEHARQNLLHEGKHNRDIVVTGNTVIDAQKYFVPSPPTNINNNILVTVHRRENWDKIETICIALRHILSEFKDYNATVVLHPNPDLTQKICSYLSNHKQISLVKSLSYPELQCTLATSKLVLTDSGGIQEEAPTYGVPVVVLRETTERPEAVNAGVASLSGASNISRIVMSAINMLNITKTITNPYGDGSASRRIVSDLQNLM